MLKKAIVVVALACCFALDPAFGQVATPEVPAVTVGQVINPWLQFFMAVTLTILPVLGTIALAIFNKKAGLENDANVLRMERMASETLQSALTNAAGKVVITLGDRLDKVPLLPNNPAIARAVASVNEAAHAAVEKFGLTPAKVAEMVANKVGVITASNPEVAPTTDPALVKKDA